jgi:hypothetical protein
METLAKLGPKKGSKPLAAHGGHGMVPFQDDVSIVALQSAFFCISLVGYPTNLSLNSFTLFLFFHHFPDEDCAGLLRACVKIWPSLFRCSFT